MLHNHSGEIKNHVEFLSSVFTNTGVIGLFGTARDYSNVCILEVNQTCLIIDQSRQYLLHKFRSQAHLKDFKNSSYQRGLIKQQQDLIRFHHPINLDVGADQASDCKEVVATHM